MLTVEQLKGELADLLQEIFEEVFGPEGTEELAKPIRVAVMEMPVVWKFLAQELRKLQIDIPEPETFRVDWSTPECENALSQHISELWVRTVASKLLPMARALAAALRRRREMHQGDTVTPQMLEQLRHRFPTTH